MKVSQREMYLGVAALACILTGAAWYIVDGKTEEWKAKKIQITKLEQQISHHQTAIKMQNNWKGDLDDLQKDLRSFESGKRSTSPELMKTIKGISSKYALNISRSQPYEEKKIGDLYEIGINCTWDGKLEAMVGFLTELQQQGVRYDVRTLNVAPVGKNTGKLKGNMVIQCVYTRSAKTAPKK